MRILVLNADYEKFLRDLYARSPGLAAESYDRQMQARNDSLFGVADFYSRNFRLHGHEAREVHANNDIIQAAWAREHNMTATVPGTASGRGLSARIKRAVSPVLGPLKRRIFPGGLKPYQAAVLRAQIESFDPDIILNQELGFVRSGFLASVKRKGRLILGQIAAALPQAESFAAYDLVITSLPNFVTWFGKRGVPAKLNRLAFDSSVLDRMGPSPPRDIDVSFVGSLSPEHADRVRLLERIAAEVPLKIWGSGIERLPKSSPLHRIYQGEAWGRQMYDILRRSRITLNRHIGLAEDHANNMRLYEATGSGAMLLTDMKSDLGEIFTPGSEVIAYSSHEECVSRIHQYLKDEEARRAVAARGQQRTLREHSYAARTADILQLAAALRGDRLP